MNLGPSEGNGELRKLLICLTSLSKKWAGGVIWRLINPLPEKVKQVQQSLMRDQKPLTDLCGGMRRNAEESAGKKTPEA